MANTNASDTEPYDLPTPSNRHVSSSSNVVTKSSGFDNSIDTQLTTPSHINLRTYFLGVKHHYHDTTISFLSPEDKISTVDRIDTPILHSSYWDLIRASLPPVKYDTSQKLYRQMFQDSKVDKKRKGKETALNLTDTMFNFLRHAIIDANALLTSLNMGKLKDVLQKIWFIENHCNAEIMDLSKDAKSR